MRGNPGGPGNPFGAARQRYRAALFRAVTDERFERIVQQLLTQAEDGERWAIREVLDRLLGKASQPIELQVSHQHRIMALLSTRVDEVLTAAIESNRVDDLPPRLRELAAARLRDRGELMIDGRHGDPDRGECGGEA